MKKTLAIILSAVLIVSMLAACGEKQNEPETNPDDAPLSGGYTFSEPVAGELPEEAKAAFDDATGEIDGLTYKPLACLGTQVVAGINYAILCEATESSENAKPEFKVLFIYRSLDGKSEITSTASFDPMNHITDGIDLTKAEMLAGGWHTPLEGGLSMMPQELATATSEAFLDFADMKFEALTCLGTQVVAGTNYALICRGINDDATDTLGLYLVVIYDSISDGASVLSVAPISVGDLHNAENAE